MDISTLAQPETLTVTGLLISIVIYLYTENKRLQKRIADLETTTAVALPAADNALTLEGAIGSGGIDGFDRAGSPRRGVSGTKPPRIPPANK